MLYHYENANPRNATNRIKLSENWQTRENEYTPRILLIFTDIRSPGFSKLFRNKSNVDTNLPYLRGKVVEKEVEKIVKGGNDMAILRGKVGVCEKCGERIYTKEVHKKIEDIRSELKQKATERYKPIGRTYAYKNIVD